MPSTSVLMGVNVNLGDRAGVFAKTPSRTASVRTKTPDCGNWPKVVEVSTRVCSLAQASVSPAAKVLPTRLVAFDEFHGVLLSHKPAAALMAPWCRVDYAFA